MKFKQSIKSIFVILLTLFVGANFSYGQISIGTPPDWYYVNFTTRVSTPSCGTTSPGEVKLNYTDNKGNQDNKYITDTKPVNPYLSDYEKYSDFNEKWGNGSERGRQEAETQDEKSNYPAEEEGVEGWSAEQVEVAKQGYDAGWGWQKRTNGDWQQESFPSNPYFDTYSRYESMKNQWDNGFNSGENVIENGYDESYPDLSYMDSWSWSADVKQAFKDGFDAGKAWYKAGRWLNSFTGEDENNYATDWGTSASLNGYAMLRMEDMDDERLGISSYAYFEAKVREKDGWYFTGWSYTEGESDLGGHVDTKTDEDKGYLFKIFPSALQGWDNISHEYAYATFKPVMVSDYKVNGIINGSGNSTTVTFDVVGERVSAKDFTCSVPEDNFKPEISCENNKVTVSVTYSGSANGEFRGNVTLASKSGCSQLTAAVYARVGGVSGKEASLYDTKVLETNLVKSDDLTKLLEEATTNQIIALNANYNKALTISKNVTIFTNGYSISSLNVTGGTVTFIYDKYNGGADAVSVTGGKLILNGGIFSTLTIGSNGTVEQNGATFTGVATNAGTLITAEGMFESGLTSTAGTLTINNGTFKGETALTISGGTAVLNRGNIEGDVCGLKVTNGTVTVKKLAAIKGETNSVLQEGGTVNIECGKFKGELSAVSSFTSGYFTDKAHAKKVETGKDWMQLTDGVEYNEGYRFYLGNSETAKNNGVGVCRIGDVSYATLEAALAYANNNPQITDIVIFMTNNYVLPRGYYTLPANATIVVPMSDTQQKINLTAPRMKYNDVNNDPNNYYGNNFPVEFRRLTFAEGVNMDVFGKIELTCTQYQSNEAYTSQPVGAYGRLVMEEGSHMTLQSGSELRAWGFMTGQGETDARRGATVREMFQMGDWKGAMASVAITGMVAGTNLCNTVKSIIQGKSCDYSDKKIFPVSQYFIQNIESPVKYHPGALLSTSAAVSEGVMNVTSVSMAATDIAIVGVSGEHTAIFLMDQEADAENTWVRKWYDVEKDIQVYDINSGAHIGSMELDMGGVNLMGASIPVKLNSAKFDLPITSNMKIHLLSGNMDFQQNTSLLPGSEVEVDKESTVSISMNKEDKAAKEAGTADHVYHSGAVYVYDQAEWDKYAFDNDSENGQKYTKVVRYTPSALSGAGGQPNLRNEDSKPASAKINVHGTFNTLDGFVYTSASGANIFSSNEDAGTFIFNNAASEAGERVVHQIKGRGNNSGHYTENTFTCAKLKNSDKSYTATQNAIQGFAFIYRDGKWQEPMTETSATFNMDCYTAEINLAAYQEIIGDEEHQENQLKIAIYHAPDNIAEYLVGSKIASQLPQAQGNTPTPQEYEYLKRQDTYVTMFNQIKTGQIDPQIAAIKKAGYDLGPAVQKLLIKPQEWVEIVGTAHAKFDMFDVRDFGTMYDQGVQEGNYDLCNQAVDAYADYFQAQLTRPYMESVEGNADHTYSDADGAGRLFIRVGDDCQWWEVEKKDNLYHCIHPQNDTYYEWESNINEETGVDEGEWKEKRFNITWKNWDGTIIQTGNADGYDDDEYSVTYGTMAEFLGTNPTRPEDVDYTYDFTGWSPELAPVTSDVTYTATYEKKERKYTITFLQEGGVEIERQFLPHNAVPVCENTPTKIGHTLVWSPAIAAVTGDATYTATWEEEPPTKYKVTFFDYDGKKILKQGNVNVGDMPTPPVIEDGKPVCDGGCKSGKTSSNGEFTYVFDHWSPEPEIVSATSIKSYVAVYKEQKKTYPVKFYFEDTEHQIGETQNVEVGQTPVIPDDDRLKKTKDEGTIYTLIWNPNIETVLGNQTEYNYVASYEKTPRQYYLTIKCSPAGAATMTGARADYTFGTNATITVAPNENYTFTGWSDGAEIGDETDGKYSRTVIINDNIDLVANFTVDNPDATISWKSMDGKTTYAEVSQKSGTATTYTGPTPTETATAEETFTFYGWSTDVNGGGVTYKNGLTPKAAAGKTTYYAYFNSTPNKYKVTLQTNNPDVCTLFGAGTYDYGTSTHIVATVRDGYEFVEWAETHTTNADLGNVEVQGDITYTAVVRETVVDKKVGIKSIYAVADGDIVKDLILESNGNASGQITNATALSVEGNAYFDLSLNADAQTWYAFGLPWQVNTNGGMTAAGQKLTIGQNCFILEYDGAARAAGELYTETNSYWKYVTAGATLDAGKLYMIYLRYAAKTIRFTAADPTHIINNTITLETNTSGNDADKGWNGVANSTLAYATFTSGWGLKYIPGVPTAGGTNTDRYEAFNLASESVVVGQPFFVQVDAGSTLTANANEGNVFKAPRLENARKSEYEIRIAPANANYTDRLYIIASEDKEDRYIIGQDLGKISVANSIPQMWINRYDTKLSVNTTEMDNYQAVYPLGINVPVDGTYTFAVYNQVADDEELYLTINGQPVWDLAHGAYAATIGSGMTDKYGLLLVRERPIPEVTTGCQNVEASENASVRKVLINGQVFILRDGAVYTIFGQKAK